MADRTSLGLLGGLGVFFVAVVLFKHEWLLPVSDSQHLFIRVEASTAFGQLYLINSVLLIFFGMLVPFLSADAVARDQKRRVHELLMTSKVTSGAYVWGRFLAAMVAVIAAALVMGLAAELTLLCLHTFGPGFPSPDPGAFALGWFLLVLPAGAVLGAVGFAAGTLWPRLATVVKVAVLLGWIGLGFVVDIGHNLGWTWFEYWNPSSTGMVLQLWPAIVARYVAEGGSPAAAMAVQQQLPSLSAWVVPHLGISLLALGAVALAAARFGRFRGDL